MIHGNNSTYSLEQIAIEQGNEIAMMFQWISRYPTLINVKIDVEASAYIWELYTKWCKQVDQKILPRLKNLRHWKMCWFQQTSHSIFMLKTLSSSDFLIFMPPINYLKFSRRNSFDFNIINLIWLNVAS